MNHPIAIVGLSCIYPQAPNKRGFWNLVRMGKSAVKEVPKTHWDIDDYYDPNPKAPDKTYCKVGAFIDPVAFDPTEFSLPPTVLEATDTSQILSLVAAKEALSDAGYTEDKTFDKEMTSVIIGVTGTLELVVPLGARLGHPYWKKALEESGVQPEITEEVMQRIANDYVPWQENSFPGLLGNVVAGRVANRLDLHGTNCVVDAACASTLSALHLSMLELSSGHADMVVTGGVDTFNDIFMYMCFSKTPALSKSGIIRPFDAESDGTLLGEGIGMCVLKRLEDAQRDNDRIYAVIKGLGTSSDGSQKAVYAPYSPGQARALRKAYKHADVDPATIGLLEAHGTGTKVGDAVEFAALKGVFAEAHAEKNSIALGTVKSQIGHTKAAAGSAGLIKAALALYHKVLPPTINITQPNPKMEIEDSAFYLNTQAKPWVHHRATPRRAGLSSFGFGGSNYHVVLEEHQSTKEKPSWDGSVEFFAFSGASESELTDQIATVLEAPKSELEALAYTSRQTFRPNHKKRLSIIAYTDTILEVIEQAQKQLESNTAPKGKGIYWGEGPTAGDLAFLYPGQGSQYTYMGRDLGCIFPEPLESLQLADDDLLKTLYPNPAWTPEKKKQQEQKLTLTANAQPALGLVEMGMTKVLKRFGLYPSVVAGHSYGELVALWSAGSYSDEELYQLSQKRGQLMQEQGPNLGTMAAVSAPLNRIEGLMAEFALDIVLANRNSPTQGVIAGAESEIDKAIELFKNQGISSQKLPVAAAFHSPLVAEAAKPFRTFMDQINFKKSQVKVYANTTAQQYPQEPSKMADLLANQLRHSVRFDEMMQSMHDSGARVFVEVGPKTVLSRLGKACLEGRDAHFISLDASRGKDGLLDLAAALAQLAALGFAVDLTQWEITPQPKRKKRMEVPLVGANYRNPNHDKDRPPVRPANSIGAQPQIPAPATAATPHLNPPPMPETSGEVNLPHDLQNTLAVMQQLAEETARAHQRFLESQRIAQESVQALLASHGLTSSEIPVPAILRSNNPLIEAAKSASMQTTPPKAETPVVTVSELVQAPVATSPAPTPQVAPTPEPAISDPLQETLLEVVADKTGYPVDMLSLDMDLEADLGIDSIKRVEILAAVEEQVENLKKVEADQMGSLRTLQEVLNAFQSDASSTMATTLATAAAVAPSVTNPAPAITAAADSNSTLHITLLEVVADKTGYPVDMLSLDMDLEADLGIDSIKRVEILAAVEEQVENLKKVEADQMGSLRTLQEVLNAFQSDASSTMATTLATAPAVAPSVVNPAPVATTASNSGLQETLLEVVADKTGYPVDMLSLDMDLEADLGIDSIKRVEILAAVEEQVENLKKVEADQMGSLRTLQEVLDAFQSDSPSTITTAVAPPAVTPSTSNSADVVPVLLAVIADKTGYPVDMLSLDMDLEADLGIDSIKRVEILAAVEEQMPNLNKVEPDQMGSLRTLQEVVDAMGSSGAATQTTSTPAPTTPTNHQAGTQLQPILLSVVADKTGYPADMLSLDMDLEADLGIDSIKRVEILAAVEEQVSGLKVDADKMGSLRTLDDIIQHMDADGGASSSPSTVAAKPKVLKPSLGRQVLDATKASASDKEGTLPLAPGKEIIIAGNDSALAQALKAKLERRELKASIVYPGDPIPLEQLGGLILLGGTQSTSISFLTECFGWTKSAVPTLRDLAQQQGACFITVTRMDGHFGLTGKGYDPYAGGLTGLAKTLAHEEPKVFCRALDIPAEITDPHFAAGLILREVASPGALEVGALEDARVQLKLVETDGEQQAQAVIDQNDVVLIVGGARGVTAACAIRLAQQQPAKYCLMGRSAIPDSLPTWLEGLESEAEIKKAILTHVMGGKGSPKELESHYRKLTGQREVLHTLAQIRATGSTVQYYSADVTDPEAIRIVISDIQKKYGSITALVHAAGVLADRRIEDKTIEQFESVFHTKIQGFENLIAAITIEQLKALFFFSSVTARFGRPGQVDYCMANDILNKVAQTYHKLFPHLRVGALGWGPWDGGMVTPALAKEFERIGVALIPMEAGATAFTREFFLPTATPAEVLLGDGFPEPPKVTLPKGPSRVVKDSFEGKLSHHPITISYKKYPFLASHEFGGRGVLPLALIQELFLEAVTKSYPDYDGITVKNMRVFRPFTITPESDKEATVIIRLDEENSDKNTLSLVVELKDGSSFAPTCRATFALRPAPWSADEVQVPKMKKTEVPAELAEAYDRVLFHGPHFHTIHVIHAMSEQGIDASVRSPLNMEGWDNNSIACPWFTDTALQMGILWANQYLGNPAIPSGSGNYQQYVPLLPHEGGRIILEVHLSSERQLVASAYLITKKGRALAKWSNIEWTVDAKLRSIFQQQTAH